MKKINNISFIILGIILVGFTVWSSTDSSVSSLKGIEHQDTLKKINACENSKMNKSFESYMTISSQFDVDWSECDLTGVVLRHISLDNANLKNSDISGALLIANFGSFKTKVKTVIEAGLDISNNKFFGSYELLVVPTALGDIYRTDYVGLQPSQSCKSDAK